MLVTFGQSLSKSVKLLNLSFKVLLSLSLLLQSSMSYDSEND